MGIDKRGVGGFLHMFDWNGRSRKKMFSSKSDVTEQSKQNRRCNGNLPTSGLQTRDDEDIVAGSSIKGSTDHSCASSVIDDDIYGTKAPGVVARLMGLDSLPKSSLLEPQTPLFDSQTLCDANYRTRSLEYGEDQVLPSSNLQGVLLRDDIGWKYQKVMNKPMEKFQTEVLPPRSAKSIPITHHKLLSPIKNGSYVPSKDAAHIMEAAARIIEPAPQESTRVKLPPVGSSSVPLRVKDLKEKAKVAQKTLKTFDGCQGKAESSAFENLRELSMSKSWNGPAYGASLRILPDMQEPFGCGKNKGKSVSLALQAKVNVQKRESLSVSSSRTSLVRQKEACEFNQSQLLTSQSTMKKQSTQSGSGVLRQNNQKQNCIIERGKVTYKCNSKGGKTFSGESSSVRQRNSSKLSATSKVSSRKLSTFDKDDKRDESSSGQERVSHKKRSIDGNYHLERNQASQNMAFNQSGRTILSSSIMGSHSRWDEDLELTGGSDVVSFTFTAPMRRSGHSVMSREAGDSGALFSSNSQNKRPFTSLDSNCSPKFSPLGQSLKGADALSNLLEQKLKELAQKVDFSKATSGEELHSIQPYPKATISSTMQQRTMDKMLADNQALSDSSTSQTRKFLDCRLPSPISVLELSSFVDSYNSDTADSSSTGSKPVSSFQTHEVLDAYSSTTPFLIEGDAELSDSVSSTSPRTVVKGQRKTLILAGSKKPRTWEHEYIGEMLHNIESKYQDYALTRAHEIISPFVFGATGSRKLNSTVGGVTPRVNHRLLSDSVCESLELRFRHFVGGGSELWAKGLSVVRRKERLADEIYKEITGGDGIGDSMIDELVDKDMSSPYGRWLDFDIEAFELGIEVESRILSSLIEEAVCHIMALQLRQRTSYFKSSVRFPSSINCLIDLVTQ